MKKLFYLVSAVLMAVFLMACNCVNRESHVAGEPDIVSSIKVNRDENLVIAANQDEIEDKVEFAKLLVSMCQENSFQSIKFSSAMGYPTSLDMRVYLWIIHRKRYFQYNSFIRFMKFFGWEVIIMQTEINFKQLGKSN